MIGGLDELRSGLEKGFVDKSILSNPLYIPELLINDRSKEKKVLSTILTELESCQEFWFSVAFVTSSGVATMINSFLELAERGVKGKILVSQYLNFSEPEALRKLLRLPNIELKIVTVGNFHSKGYLFTRGNIVDLIIGSSNLTAGALCVNKEWNLKVTATTESHIICAAIEEFASEFDGATPVTNQFIEDYKVLYDHQRAARKQQEVFLENIGDRTFVPNKMQEAALNNLTQLRQSGIRRALLISATGTGKTFLSAFDVQKFNPKRFLFVVHRANIAHAAIRTFRHVFGEKISMGVYSGSAREIEADFLFSTIQTISKENHLAAFEKDHFDYIVIDESHHSGAESYRRLLDHFEPKFLLGMTATPERTDGFDVFQLYDHNIAYEIRLHQAMEEEMLCPFHYYGVTDISVNGKILEEKADFNKLVAFERINKIIERIEQYGCDDGTVRGLVFCSRVDECQALSIEFNSRGYKTLALSGIDDDNERAEAINRLESDSINRLDFLFSVDIFNEGVDIPRVNLIVMLRPTQSAIVFVQQLGRGLRKTENKKYLTVIDFIGNYDHNYMVPIALYGDTSYNKDTLRKLMSQGSGPLPGASTINFDKITKERIYASIDSARLQLRQDLVRDYRMLKYRLGRIPMMTDFLEQEGRDPFHFVSYSKSYFNFVSSVEDKLKGELSTNEIKLLELFSTEINNSKRIEESFILKGLIELGRISIRALNAELKANFEFEVSMETLNSCMINLNFEFVRNKKSIATTNGKEILIDYDLQRSLDNEFFRQFLLDSTLSSIEKYRRAFNKGRFVNGFVLYNKYSRKDVCRILNWPEDISSTVYGYRTKNRLTPCFVTYHKSNQITDSTKYNDHFIDKKTFAWESRSNRKKSSPEILSIIDSKRILLFIKKEDSEGSDFYFTGDVDIASGGIEQGTMDDRTTPVVKFQFVMKQAVDDSLYSYLTQSNISKSDVIQKAGDVVLETHGENQHKDQCPFRILNFDEIEKFINCIPMYDNMVAAGSFSNEQRDAQAEWIQLPMPFKHSKGYFVCKVVGESMNKLIPNGSWCLFREEQEGSRNGKTVLVEHSDIQDPDFGAGYTVKVYHSEKKHARDMELWEHERILLQPKSTDASFKNIVLTGDGPGAFKIIGEFVSVLNT